MAGCGLKKKKTDGRLKSVTTHASFLPKEEKSPKSIHSLSLSPQPSSTVHTTTDAAPPLKSSFPFFLTRFALISSPKLPNPLISCAFGSDSTKNRFNLPSCVRFRGTIALSHSYLLESVLFWEISVTYCSICCKIGLVTLPNETLDLDCHGGALRVTTQTVIYVFPYFFVTIAI
ncbi:uncharacterized protein LOC131333834 isoform X2 [Rhododendron vialii]|uniref:uncharacterized protein LOC131333834 isoform X2 n=1 Tax=Rhododendron vialii TaxID=182163 RepID=UPI00265E2322|nr:uncharacterized protein LOC131333834 isoform X2 [Rhododendron vialii]